MTVPDRQSLTCLELIHAGGPVEVRASAELETAAAVKVGCSAVEPGGPVAVDLRWEGAPAGTLVAGTLEAAGVGPHPVFVLFADEESGLWELSNEASEQLARRLDGRRRPTTSAELLALAAVVEGVA